MNHEHLPEGWNLVQLGNVLKKVRRPVDIDPDAGYRQIGIRSHGKGIFHKQPILGRDLGNKSIFWVKPGDFVLNIVFAWEGAVAVVTDAELGMCGSHRFPTFVVNPDKLELDYLLLYFKSQEGIVQLESVSPGGAGRNKTLSQSDFLRLKIPLPPIDEQCQIVEVMHDIEVNIARVESQITAAQQVKRGVMQQLFTYGLAGEVAPTKETDAGKIPQHWSIEPLKKHTESSAFGPRFPSNAYDDNGKIATLRTTDLDENGFINYETMPRANLNEIDFASHILQKGDLTITRSGTIGVVSVFDSYRLPVIPGAFLIKFRLHNTVLPDFLRHYLNADIGRMRIMGIAAGGVQKNLQGSAMLRLKIPVPPIEEQREITEILSAHDVTILKLRGEAASLREVKRGLMQKLLSGKVRV